MELVDILDLKSGGLGRAGSSPASRTNLHVECFGVYLLWRLVDCRSIGSPVQNVAVAIDARDKFLVGIDCVHFFVNRVI